MHSAQSVFNTCAMSMSKKWMVTLYGDAEPLFVPDEMQYLVFQREVCPSSGRTHYQTFVIFKSRKRMETVKRLMGNNAHVEPARSDDSTCISYCTKLDTRASHPKEFGEKPQRKRKVHEMLHMDVRSILEEQPQLWRSVRQLKEAKLALSLPRNTPTETILLTGGTGTGKSKISHLISQYLGEAAWIDPALQWFDQYEGQALAIVDEFRGCSASQILRLADRYPLRVPIKGSFVEWRPSFMILTSNLSFEEIFGSLDEKTKSAVRRRIKEYVVY